MTIQAALSGKGHSQPKAPLTFQSGLVVTDSFQPLLNVQTTTSTKAEISLPTGCLLWLTEHRKEVSSSIYKGHLFNECCGAE